MTAGSPAGRFTGVVIGVVVLVIGAGLVLIGSPGEARRRRLDERRVEDLRQTSYAVDHYRRRHGRLPETLDVLMRETRGAMGIQDPVTHRPYGYRAIDSVKYELCGTFDRASDDADRRLRWPDDVSWAHGAGHHCFQLEYRTQRS